MFGTDRQFVLASLPADATKKETRRFLLKRFYNIELEELIQRCYDTSFSFGLLLVNKKYYFHVSLRKSC
jgi:hypothetical protein